MKLDIYVYGDESGTFDAKSHEYYVLAGLIALGRDQKDSAIRRYIAAERAIAPAYPGTAELKACNLSPKHKMSLFRSMNNLARFACVIEQAKVNPEIMANKKSRQRFLDFAFKIALKRCLLQLVETDTISQDGIDDLLISFDQHKTATNGRYELQESIAAEFKDGVIAYDGHYVRPEFPEMGRVKTRFVDSRGHALVRAADILANVTLHYALEDKLTKFPKERVHLTLLP